MTHLIWHPCVGKDKESKVDSIDNESIQSASNIEKDNMVNDVNSKEEDWDSNSLAKNKSKNGPSDESKVNSPHLSGIEKKES